jgi:hypothetical protein
VGVPHLHYGFQSGETQACSTGNAHQPVMASKAVELCL